MMLFTLSEQEDPIGFHRLAEDAAWECEVRTPSAPMLE